MFDALMVQLPAAFSVERLSEFVFNAVLNVTTAAIVFLSFMLFGDCCAVGWYPESDSSLIKTGVQCLTALKAAGLSIGVLMVLNAAGVQTAEVLTFLGVLSLTIGFALRDALSNIISGFLVLLTDRSCHSLVFGTNNPDCAREPKPYMAVTKLNDYNAWASNKSLA